MKLPSLKLPKIDLPRPARWDWIAIGALLLGALLTVARSKPPGEPYPSGLTTFFVFSQLAVACAGLMVLGKTAKEGTGWGNAASLLAMFLGISGVLLALSTFH